MPEALTAFCMPGPCFLGHRIVVIGSTCAGKTALARHLAALLHIKHIELDALYWGPSWNPEPIEQLRQVCESLAAGDKWVLDGNYSKLRDIIWPRAESIIWLDYELPVILWRWFIRTFTRVVTRERLWNDNIETFQEAVLSKESLLFYIFRTFDKRRQAYRNLLLSTRYQSITRIILTNPRKTEGFLRIVQRQACAEVML